MSDHDTGSAYADDEITFFELVQVLVRRKVVIAATFVACILGGLGYAFLATPRYEVEVRVDSPTVSEIAVLNVGRNGITGLKPLTPEQVFGYFSSQLASDFALQRFFREVYLPSLDESERGKPEGLLREKLLRAVKVIKPDPKGRNQFALKVEADNGEKAVRHASAFLELAAREATSKVVGDVKKEIDMIVRNTEKDVEELRTTATKQRQDRVVQLSEALQVAQAVGVKDPQITSGRLPAQDQVAPFVDGTQLYARGTKSLAAELGVLKARQSDDPFITGLREAESRLRVLKSLQFDEKAFKVFNPDGEIIVPERPVAPKKALVLVLTAVLGLVGGVLLAFASEFAVRARNRTPVSSN